MKVPITILGATSPATQKALQRPGFESGNGRGTEALGLLLRSQKIDLAEYPRLAAIARAGIGVDNIDLGAATERGIPVFFAPGGSTRSVAELTLLAIGAFQRRIHEAITKFGELGKKADGLNRFYLVDSWTEEVRKNLGGAELGGQRLGVVGLGRIGVAVANLGVALGMDVIGYEPALTAENAHTLSSRVSRVATLDEVGHASIVTVHVGLTDATRGLIGDEFLSRWHNHYRGLLANFARAGVCDEEAVKGYLDRCWLRGYVTDFPQPWHLGRSDVLALPHLGASTEEAQSRCGEMAAQALVDFFETGAVRNSVNFPTVEPGPVPDGCLRLAFANRNHPGMLAKVLDEVAARSLNVTGNAHRSLADVGYGVIDIERSDGFNEEAANALAGVLREIPNVLMARRVG